MATFGRSSQVRLDTCDQRLQDLFNNVIQHVDCSILEGYRDQATQDEYYRTGRSHIKWPNGKHNSSPSKAVDVVPYFKNAPHIRWDDKDAFYHFAGFVLGVASQMDIIVRWGGNWNMNDDLHDSSFIDMPHFELVD